MNIATSREPVKRRLAPEELFSRFTRPPRPRETSLKVYRSPHGCVPAAGTSQTPPYRHLIVCRLKFFARGDSNIRSTSFLRLSAIENDEWTPCTRPVAPRLGSRFSCPIAANLAPGRAFRHEQAGFALFRGYQRLSDCPKSREFGWWTLMGPDSRRFGLACVALTLCRYRRSL